MSWSCTASIKYNRLKGISFAELQHKTFHLPEFAALASHSEESATGIPRQELEGPTVHIV